MGTSKQFDHYIFIDYSEDLIGYILVSKNKLIDVLKRTSKLKHYKTLKFKKQYLQSMKKLFESNEILKYLDRHKITELRQNVELCSEIFDFCKKNVGKRIFISVDDRQYKGFMKILKSVDGEKVTIVKEGKLKTSSETYKLSLIIDTLLNLKRIKK